jgi:hypothetical protein
MVYWSREPGGCEVIGDGLGWGGMWCTYGEAVLETIDVDAGNFPFVAGAVHSLEARVTAYEVGFTDVGYCHVATLYSALVLLLFSGNGIYCNQAPESMCAAVPFSYSKPPCNAVMKQFVHGIGICL